MLRRMTSFNTLLLAPAAAVQLVQRRVRRSEYTPEIQQIIDLTNHRAGMNPYYRRSDSAQQTVN